MIEARAAKYWRMRPSQFNLLETNEQARLMAIYLVETAVESYYESEKARILDETESRPSKSKGIIKPGS